MTEIRPDNFIVAPARATLALAAFFGQFERAYPGFVPVMTEQDQKDAARDLRAAATITWDGFPGRKHDPWDGSPLAGFRDPHDGRAHAREFAARMRAEAAQRADAPREFRDRMRREREGDV